MLVMFDTPHSPIGPCGSLGQSPLGDNFRHASTALLSSGLDCGENAGMGRSGVGQGRNSSGWDSCTEKITIKSTLYESRFGLVFEQDSGCALARSPPLQEFGDMMTRSIRKYRTRRPHGKRICAWWRINLVVCVYLRARLCLYAHLCAHINA